MPAGKGYGPTEMKAYGKGAMGKKKKKMRKPGTVKNATMKMMSNGSHGSHDYS